ncbi:hypothetical protein K525DRAFT_191212 [Schizophyllum commune Loenen D]|nr:hypothetical protein K525DRAFT_191212 [Schizophyllum commune Loenen D]
MEVQETIPITEPEGGEQSIPADDDVLDEEETQETADGEEPTEESATIEESAPTEGSAPAEEPADPTGKKKRKAPAPDAEREPGKTLLPFTRVQKIIKADKEIQMIARDATFLISLAAEEFIRRFVQAGQRVAEREKRATVQHRDLATVVRKADEFIFLEGTIPPLSSIPPHSSSRPTDPIPIPSLLCLPLPSMPTHPYPPNPSPEIIPWTSPDPAPKRGKKQKEDEEAKKNAAAAPPTILDTFVGARPAKGTAGREGGGDGAGGADDTGGASGAVDTQVASIRRTPAPASVTGDAASDIVMTENGTMEQHDSD